MKNHKPKTANSSFNLSCLLIGVIIFSNFLFWGCNKDKDLLQDDQGNYVTKTLTSPTLYYDILEFASAEDLDEQLQQLNDDNDAFVADFLFNEFGLGEEDDLPEDADVLEYIDVTVNAELNVYQVYEDFEDVYGFTSLRQDFAPAMATWMANSGDDDYDPFLEYPYPIAFMSVLNPYHEIKIEDAIYKFDPSTGFVYIITDGDYNTVTELRANIEAATEMENVIIYGMERSGSCKTFKSANTTSNYSTGGKNFRLKTYCSMTTVYLTGVTQNFRRYNSGALIWSICPMTNAIVGTELYNNSNCSGTQTSASLNSGNKKNRFRMEHAKRVLYNGYQWLNVHAPSGKVYTYSQRFSPYLSQTVYAY